MKNGRKRNGKGEPGPSHRVLETLLLSALLLLLGGVTAQAGARKLSAPMDASQEVTLGDEDFDAYLPLLEGKRVALFSNQTGIVGNQTSWDYGPGNWGDPSLVPLGTDGYGQPATFGPHVLDVLLEKGIEVTCIFSPEHGFRGTQDAGAVVDSSRDEKTGVPIFSLYDGNTHAPSQKAMDSFDTLVMDVQDVGLRYYTYHIGMYYLMDACAKEGKKVVVLDRPNPNGFYMDGPLLREDFISGVGRLPLPVVYGLTWGELSRMINGEGWLSQGADALDLTVIPCQNYAHEDKTFLIMPPSPNLKDMKSIYLYASTCYFENTVVSVGRGTAHPFETFGSPYLKGLKEYSYRFTPESIPGATHPPYLGEVCFGMDLREKPLEEIWQEGICLTYLLKAYEAIKASHPELVFFQPDKEPCYVDLLFGTDAVRLSIQAGESEDEIKESWQEELFAFREQSRPYLLYP